MKHTFVRGLLAAAAAAACVSPASALNIVLWDTNNSYAASPEALLAFQKAANYWNKTISTDATVNIQIGFADLGKNILAQAGSNASDVSVANVYSALKTNAAAAGASQLDKIAASNLVALDSNGSLTMRVNGYADAANKVGVDTTVGSRLVSGDHYGNQNLYVNTSVQKALGLYKGPAKDFDATITFSSSFGFDYNPTNGVDKGKYDFVAVAIHELGHSLGFVSGTDTFDWLGASQKVGGGKELFESGAFGSANTDDYAFGSTLDLFRYGINDAVNGHLQLQWGANKDAYFSIDGKTPFNYDSNGQSLASFSTGALTGDKHQASHWKDTDLFPDASQPGCYLARRDIGIMDPTGTPCLDGHVTQNDLAAFDAMGWNLSVDALKAGNYSISTKDVYAMEGVAAVVPEPATYAQLVLGLGLVGGLLRSRRKAQAQA